MNDIMKAILERYSCRAFTDRAPEESDLREIARAAMAAPSGMNAQPWRAIFVRDRALIEEMDAEAMALLGALEDKSTYERMMQRGGKLFYNAPCLIMVPISTGVSAGAALDCGILCENIALAARSFGLDSLICGLASFVFAGEKKDYFEKKLGFPPGYSFGMAVLLGYGEKDGKPHEPDMSKVTFI